MITYNCPRCGHRSTPEQCPVCGRGPEPLLVRLTELDQALQVLSTSVGGRSAIEAERAEVLDELGRLAAAYRAEATPPAGAVPAPSAGAAPATPPPPPSAPPLAAPVAPARPPAEVASKTVQTTLLSLGGLLVAAAIVIFTAVAWRHMGDAGRLVSLAAFTAVLLALPAILIRYRLHATAETIAALASLAVWSSALAGYYLYLPAGASLSAEAVGTLTMLVLAVLTAYRAVVAATATGWALLPLAAIGGAFAAAGEVVNAALVMFAIAVVLAAASWLAAHRPGHYPRADTWVSRLLLSAAVVMAFLAGLRVAFGLSEPIVPVVAAAVAFLAAANLLAALHIRRAGASLNTVLVAFAATASLIVAAWVLTFRAEAAPLAIPALALLGAVITTAASEAASADGEPGRRAAALAAIAALGGFGVVAFDAPDLTAYLVAALAVGAASLAPADPLRGSLRSAGFIGGSAVAATSALFATVALPVIWWGLEADAVLTWEVPTVLAIAGLAVPLAPRTRRFEVAALAAMFALVATAGLLWRESGIPETAAVGVLALAVVVAFGGALSSPTLSGRCTGWAALTVWLPATAGAAGASDELRIDATHLEFWLVVAAGAMLATAAGALRRSRVDRVLAAILAHILAGTTVGTMLVTEWFAQLIEGSATSRFVPAAIGVYTVALAGAALMAPTRHLGYSIAAFCTGTVAWWTLLMSYSVETIEYFTGPPALLLFVFGLWRLARRPEIGSWSALAPAVAIGLGPSLLLALGDDGEAARRIGVGAAALVVVVAGLSRRWQAPLVLGSIVLAVLTINELALVWHAIPKWIPLALGGAVLIFAGATFEKRRRDLARLRDGLRAMR